MKRFLVVYHDACTEPCYVPVLRAGAGTVEVATADWFQDLPRDMLNEQLRTYGPAIHIAMQGNPWILDTIDVDDSVIEVVVKPHMSFSDLTTPLQQHNQDFFKRYARNWAWL